MTAEDAIRSAIFDTVLQGYTRPSDGLKPSYQPDVLVTRVWPVFAVDPRQYGKAWSPTNPTGDPAATENLSLLVDSIPLLSEAYQRSGRGVEDEYKNVLDFATARRDGPATSGAELDSASAGSDDDDGELPDIVARELAERTEQTVISPNGKKISTVVMSATAKESGKAAVEYANHAARLAAIRTLQPRSTAADRQGLEAAASAAKAAATTAFVNLQTSERAATAAALKAMPSASLDSFDDPADAITRAFSKASLIFERSALGSLRNPGLDYHPAYLSPEDWTDPASSSNWPHLSIPVLVAGSPILLSLAFSRVDIVRPWLIMSLFNLPGWHTLKGPGNLSTGDAKNNPGSFALLPVSLIVARDICAVDQNTKAVLYQAQGLQILAWANKVMPFSPPH